jgi:DNA-binding NtrC family response regulator
MPGTAAAQEGMSKSRVLIVDDDVNLSRLSVMILENSGTALLSKCLAPITP